MVNGFAGRPTTTACCSWSGSSNTPERLAVSRRLAANGQLGSPPIDGAMTEYAMQNAPDLHRHREGHHQPESVFQDSRLSRLGSAARTRRPGTAKGLSWVAAYFPVCTGTWYDGSASRDFVPVGAMYRSGMATSPTDRADRSRRTFRIIRLTDPRGVEHLVTNERERSCVRSAGLRGSSSRSGNVGDDLVADGSLPVPRRLC